MRSESPERLAYEALLAAVPDCPQFPRLREALGRGENVDDRELDAVFPETAQVLSRIHWTPVRVVRRTCQFLIPRPGTRVLDVGSGVGKFCLVGSLLSAGEFTGIEQRAEFVRLARQIGQHYRISRAAFFHGNARDLDWAAYDAIYLYNPYCEARYPQRQIDLDIPAGPAVFREYVRMTRAQLRRCQIGTRVALYHGFGGRMPESYELSFSEPCGSGQLDGWIKVR